MVINFTKLNRYAQIPEELEDCRRPVFVLRSAEDCQINPLEWKEVSVGLTMFLPPKCIARVHQHPELFEKECMISPQIFSQSAELKVNIFNTRFPIEFLIGKNTNAPGLGAAKSRASFFGSVNCAQFKQGEAIGFLTIEKTESVSIKEVGI